MSEPDFVGHVLEQWRAERPDLDVSPVGVIARLHRLAARLTEELVAEYAEHGLGEGEFDVLATLRRAGAPYELTPGALAASTMVSSGAITKRVDRLAGAGLGPKRVGATDGRSRVVALPAEGVELIDRLIGDHTANEHRLLAGLTELDRTRLASLLERWGRQLGV